MVYKKGLDMKSTKEYKMIKDEIMYMHKAIQELRSILYVAVASVLTFAVGKTTPLLCLVPYCVIIPTYIVTIDYQFSMWKLGAYLLVFQEGKEYNWETRLHIFNTKEARKSRGSAKSFHSPFIATALICTILFFAKIDYKNISHESWMQIVLAILLLAAVLCYRISRRNPDAAKSEFIKEWTAVKKNEKNE